MNDKLMQFHFNQLQELLRKREAAVEDALAVLKPGSVLFDGLKELEAQLVSLGGRRVRTG